MRTDEEIIALFFARSEQGIRELDLKYGRVCHRLSYNILGDAQDAEECVSDAYLGAWNAIPPAKPDPLLTYICKIVRNVSLKLQEKKRAAKRRKDARRKEHRRENKTGGCRSPPHPRRPPHRLFIGQRFLHILCLQFAHRIEKLFHLHTNPSLSSR